MKEDWKIKKLTDVLWFQEGPGVRKHQYTTSGVKLLNVANLVNGKVDLSTSDRYISEEEAYGKYKHFLADEGDLILASSGIQVEYIEKKMGFITKEHLPLCMNTSTIRFKSLDKGVLDIAFFMYFLKSFHFKEQLSKLITGIAQLNFGPSHLKQMTIPVPSLPEQKRILAELDCLSGVIEKQKQQLKELDNLAQAIFYDMFGDPITNEKGWDIKKLEKLCDILDAQRKPVTKKDRREGCYPYYGATGIQDYVDSYIFDGRYLLVGEDGAKWGALDKTAFIIEGKCWVNNHAHILKINNLAKDTYLEYYLTVRDLNEYITGAIVPKLTQQALRNIAIPTPPMDLQTEFAAKIVEIEKQKELIKQSLSETETLFNSRMDYYFN